jgi:hypothetical protein
VSSYQPEGGGTAGEAPVFRTLSTESNKNDRPIVLCFSGNPSHRKGADPFCPVMKQLGSEYELRATSGLLCCFGLFV